jgi:hypothetical protein
LNYYICLYFITFIYTINNMDKEIIIQQPKELTVESIF